MYVAIGTRPDISFAVSKLAGFLDCHRSEHWKAAINVAKYLKGTRTLRLRLGGQQNSLIGFTDSSYADCLDTLRSTMGYTFNLGGGAITWASRKQKVVVTSTTESEYIATSEALKEAIWLRQLFSELELLEKEKPTPLHCDNNGATCLVYDPAFHARVKHLDIRYHYVRERVVSGEISVNRIATADNVADIFTKALARQKFTTFREMLGVV